jgi:hypothetical protein
VYDRQQSRECAGLSVGEDVSGFRRLQTSKGKSDKKSLYSDIFFPCEVVRALIQSYFVSILNVRFDFITFCEEKKEDKQCEVFHNNALRHVSSCAQELHGFVHI